MTVRGIRSFDRIYTSVGGAPGYGRHLYAPYTLTESRVRSELAHPEQSGALDAAEPRARSAASPRPAPHE